MPEEEALIHTLPTEVLQYIIGLVSPYNDLQSCKLVCKKWLEIVQGISMISCLLDACLLTLCFRSGMSRCGEKSSDQISSKHQQQRYLLGNTTTDT